MKDIDFEEFVNQNIPYIIGAYFFIVIIYYFFKKTRNEKDH